MRRIDWRLVSCFTASVLIGACPVELPQEQAWTQVSIERSPKEKLELEERKKRARLRRATEMTKKRKFALVKEDERTCEKDKDCRLVTTHCCSCERGGSLTAMRKEPFQLLIKRRVRGCTENVCPQMISRNPSCMAKKAICKNNKCVVDMATSGFKPRSVDEGIGVEEIPPDGAPPAKP